jgi:Cu2+-containing amine oxidase
MTVGNHVDHTFGGEVRPVRRLVVSSPVTVADYEYLVYWRSDHAPALANAATCPGCRGP